jgi:ketosteroid isomerase-like protein
MIPTKTFQAYCLLLCTIVTTIVTAQEKKVAPTSKVLFDEISAMDSVLFTAYNNQDISKLKTLFTEDLEWFQDNGGLISYKEVIDNFENIFKKPYKLNRQLVKGTLEVHPVKNYGAIEIGTHQFRHIENGKEEIGNFKFLMIWQKIGEKWKLSRVVSYDH